MTDPGRLKIYSGTSGWIYAGYGATGSSGYSGMSGYSGSGVSGYSGAQAVVAYSRSFMIANPTSASDGPVWRVPVAVTITAVHVLCMDGTNVVGQLWEYDSNGLNGATVDASDITGTAGTNVTDTTFSNPGIASGNYIGWKTTSVSGAVTKVIITVDFVTA
jgi:hypothetical protein